MSEVDKYSELKLVAGKATPGPWWVDSHGMNMTSLPNLDLVFSHPANGEAVRSAETGNLSHWRNDWDASYIATANPKTILELISDFDAQRLRADAAEAELADMQHWRDLALQFDNHRMTALGHLRAVVRCSDRDLLTNAEEFLKAPPLAAHEVVAKLDAAEQRIAELTNVERVTMAILGKDKDPSPGVNWTAHRMWRVNDVRELVSAALNPNPEAESHE